MDHPPMLDDEIILCTAVMVVGFLVGCVARWLYRKSPRQVIDG